MKWYLGIDLDNVGTYYISDANHCVARKDEAKPFASIDEAEEYARQNNIPQWEDIKKSPIWSGSNIPKIKIYNSIAPLWDCVKKLNKEFDSLPEVKMNLPIQKGSRADAILESINKVGEEIRRVIGVV